MTLCELTKQRHMTQQVSVLGQNRTENPCEAFLFQQFFNVVYIDKIINIIINIYIMKFVFVLLFNVYFNIFVFSMQLKIQNSSL
jgi:hypothetical protein